MEYNENEKSIHCLEILVHSKYRKVKIIFKLFQLGKELLMRQNIFSK